MVTTLDQIEIVKNELQESQQVLESFLKNEANIQAIAEAAEMMASAIKDGGTIYSCGNGGSSCDAAHFAEEMTGRFREDREPFPAICINDAGHITCTANDLGFERIFSRFIRGVGRKGDVLMAISTSGNSLNVINAAEISKQKNIKVVALTGKSGGHLSEYADVEIRVPHEGYADRIQEVHIKVIHILIHLIEKQLA